MGGWRRRCSSDHVTMHATPPSVPLYHRKPLHMIEKYYTPDVNDARRPSARRSARCGCWSWTSRAVDFFVAGVLLQTPFSCFFFFLLFLLIFKKKLKICRCFPTPPLRLASSVRASVTRRGSRTRCAHQIIFNFRHALQLLVQTGPHVAPAGRAGRSRRPNTTRSPKYSSMDGTGGGASAQASASSLPSAATAAEALALARICSA